MKHKTLDSFFCLSLATLTYMVGLCNEASACSLHSSELFISVCSGACPSPTFPQHVISLSFEPQKMFFTSHKFLSCPILSQRNLSHMVINSLLKTVTATDIFISVFLLCWASGFPVVEIQSWFFNNLCTNSFKYMCACYMLGVDNALKQGLDNCFCKWPESKSLWLHGHTVTTVSSAVVAHKRL